MKTKILGLLTVGLFLLSSASNAVVITISGSGGGADGQWNVSTVFGSSDALLDTLDDQIWWGDQALARLFTAALTDGLGYPNRDGSRGPAFIWRNPVDVINDIFLYRWGCSEGFGCYPVGLLSGQRPVTETFAIASRVTAAPEPGTLVLLCLGLAGLGVSRRRRYN